MPEKTDNYFFTLTAKDCSNIFETFYNIYYFNKCVSLGRTFMTSATNKNCRNPFNSRLNYTAAMHLL